MQGLAQDLAFAARIWRRRPWTAALAVTALASGIAATTLAFAVLNGFFLRPLPVRDPGGLVRIYSSTPQGIEHFTVSHPDFADIRDLDAVFAGVVAEQPVPFSLVAGRTVERVYGAIVAGGYFSVLGVRPAAGRFFSTAEERAVGATSVVVISYDLWRRRFNEDRAAIGSAATINGRPCVVVGVAPRKFHGFTTGVRPDVWRPAGRDRTVNRGGRGYFVAARLQPGVSVGAARAALDALALRLQREYPETNSGVRFPLLTESSSRVHPMVRGHVLGLSGTLLAAGAGMLLLACANVAGVMLAATVARRKEIAERLALGASRRRVVRQLLTEAAVLSVLAGVAGLAFAWIGTAVLRTIDLPTRIPIFIDFGLDWRVAASSTAATLATALLSGGVAAVHGTRVDLMSVLKGSFSGTTKLSLVRSSLIAAQVALATALLMVGALFLRSLANVRDIHPGFEPRGVATVSVDPGLHGYADAARERFWEHLRERLIASPGAASVAFATAVPFELNITRVAIGPEGYQPRRDVGWPSIDWSAVSPDYFSTLGIPVIEGRPFARAELRGPAAVAVVNRELARRFWGNRPAQGRRLVTEAGIVLLVVGVVGNSRHLMLGEDDKPHVYFPFDDRSSAGTVLLKSSGDARGMVETIRRTVASLDPALPVYNASTMEDHVSTARLPSIAAATAAAIVAAIALLLTTIGLYATVSQTMAGRSQEIAVRYALGARGRDVLRLVLGQTIALGTAGAAAGFVGGIAASRVLRVLLFDVDAADPLVALLAPAVVAAACAVAAGLPALGALRINMAAALRLER